jgi:hypothetical protein
VGPYHAPLRHTSRCQRLDGIVIGLLQSVWRPMAIASLHVTIVSPIASICTRTEYGVCTGFLESSVGSPWPAHRPATGSGIFARVGVCSWRRRAAPTHRWRVHGAIPNRSASSRVDRRPQPREAAAGSGGEEVAGEVKEDRGGEAERVDAIEDAAMAGDEGAEVLNATVALDRRHRKPTAEPHQRDHR